MPDVQINLHAHRLVAKPIEQTSFPTLLAQIPPEFFKDPWFGAHFYMRSPCATMCYETLDSHVRQLEDLQSFASIFRELMKANEVSEAICALNVEAVPKLPGNVGSIFGFHAFIVIWISMDDFSYRIHPYEDWDGTPEIAESIESAIKDMWELRLREPFDDCMRRMFLPLNRE